MSTPVPQVWIATILHAELSDDGQWVRLHCSGPQGTPVLTLATQSTLLRPLADQLTSIADALTPQGTVQ